MTEVLMRYRACSIIMLVAVFAGVAAAQSATPAEAAPPQQETKVSYPTGDVFASPAEVVADGYSFTEGCAFVPSQEPSDLGGFFIFCDVRQRTVYRWNGAGHTPEAWRAASGGAVGSAVATEASVVQCQVETRSVVRVPLSGDTNRPAETLATAFEGKRFNCPNDLVVARDGSVWFTDPPFFTPKDELELEHTGVYRIDSGGAVTLKAKAPKYANGLAFSPDEKTLYVNDFQARKTVKFAISEAGELGEAEVVADLGELAKQVGATGRGGADGLRVRADGTILATGPGGVYAFAPDGTLKDFLPTGSASNVAIGGKNADRVIVTAGGRVMTATLVAAR